MAKGREDRIRERAHALWEEGGRQDGHHDRDWERATREIDAQDSEAGQPKGRRAAGADTKAASGAKSSGKSASKSGAVSASAEGGKAPAKAKAAEEPNATGDKGKAAKPEKKKKDTPAPDTVKGGRGKAKAASRS